MPALFPKWTNSAARMSLAVLALAAVGAPATLLLYMRTPFATEQLYVVDQPVEFDHRHHVKDDGIDCLYCHAEAETSPSAGIPATSVCMGCHGQVWNESPLLEPVRRSWFSGTPIAWQRVHDLPDFVHFNHAAHVTKGIGCESCHGRVDEMPRVYQVQPLTMSWCLECHRDPGAQVRPREAVTTMGYAPAGDAAALRRQLTNQYNVRSLTDCTTCHR